MRRPTITQHILSQVVLLLIAFFVLLPIWSMSRLAFDGSLKAAPVEFRLVPRELSVLPLLQVLDRPYQSVTFVEPVEAPQGEKGPYRTATVQSKQTLTQVMLSKALGLDSLVSTKVGNTHRKR